MNKKVNYRKIKKIQKGEYVFDGAGVRIKRIFGFYEKGEFDPFLLFDLFGSGDSKDYIKGFPWHPHRGMETITYLLEGAVEHGDSLQNKGRLENGDLQWMNAGSGIIHQEMPKPSSNGKMYGFQLWVNLPAKSKMIKPNYQEIKSKEVPIVKISDDIKLKVLAGEFNNVQGPVKDVFIKPKYFDIEMSSNNELILDVEENHTVIAALYSGSASFDESSNKIISYGECIIFDEGNKIKIKTKNENAKFLIISGAKINEPIAWRGPIVMNTDEELELAFEEYRNGNFVKT